MKLNVFGILFLATILFSCKKDDTPSSQKVSSKGPEALSKSIKVWHGTRQNGSIPAPNGNGPMVEGPQTDHVIAFGGKFAVVQPTVYSGDIKGYYVQIEGAPDYFKIDYSQPRTTGRNILRKNKNNIARRDPPPSSSDSNIVLILPPNIQTPDTFCIIFYPYDSSNNVGYPVTTCIVVAQLGGNTTSDWLQGNWRMFANKDENSQSVYDTLHYNQWAVENNYGSEYACVTDAGGNSYVTTGCDPYFISCTPLNISDSIFYEKGDIAFNLNGGMEYWDIAQEKYVDQLQSTCSSIVFSTFGWNDFVTGGWSISGNRMILIFEYDYSGTPEYDAWEYDLAHPDNNTFILTDAVDINDTWSVIFKRH